MRPRTCMSGPWRITHWGGGTLANHALGGGDPGESHIHRRCVRACARVLSYACEGPWRRAVMMILKETNVLNMLRAPGIRGIRLSHTPSQPTPPPQPSLDPQASPSPPFDSAKTAPARVCLCGCGWVGGWAGGVMPAPRPPFRAALLAQTHLATWNMRIMRMRVNSVRDGITSVTSCRPA